MASITRAEAAKLIHDQMNDIVDAKKKWRKDGRVDWEAWHYGICELRDLLDEIYGPPTCKEEEIMGLHSKSSFPD